MDDIAALVDANGPASGKRGAYKSRDHREDLSMTFYIFLSFPIILLAGAWAVLKKIFGQKNSLPFVFVTSIVLAVNLYIGFQVAAEYAARGGWTAATLTPFFYWMNGCLIVTVLFCLWLSGLYGVMYYRRRHKGSDRPPNSH